MSNQTVPHFSDRRRAGLVSLRWLLLLLAAALGLAYTLIPRQSELVERLVEDGRHDRALALVGEGIAADGGVTQLSSASLVEALLDSFVNHFDKATEERIDSLVRVTDDPAAVRQVLLARRSLLPDELLPKLLDHLAVRAVHAGDPKLAVTIYGDLEAIEPLDLEQTTKLIAACRFSGNPRAALDASTRYLSAQRLPFSQLPEDLRMTIIALHREVNEGSAALDLLSEEFKATLDPRHRQELVELITTVAAQSDRVGDSLPILETYLTKMDAAKADWRELLGRKSQSDTDPEFVRFGRTLAQHYEWANRTDEAFDLYRKLAAMGDLDSLDRCITIYPWIDRQEDATNLLEAMAPVKERETYTLLLGRLQSERGHFPEAETIYRAELAGSHAKDPSVWAELAGILDAQDRFGEALEAYRAALSLDDERHDIRVKLARLHVTLGDHSAALLAYRRLPAEAHDRKTREDYGMIAQSLDSPRDFIAAVRLKMDAESKAEPGHYLDLADAWEVLEQPESVEAVLQEGLEKLPGSAPLVLRLSDFLSQMDRKQEAFDLLSKTGKTTDKRFVARVLSLGSELGRYQETLQMVSATLGEEWSPGERYDLGQMFEDAGAPEKALEQYRAAEDSEIDIARLEAEISYSRGDLNSALKQQIRYLAMVQEPEPDGWTFLGDLHRALGHDSDAEVAYRTALEHLKKQIVSEPAANPAVVTAP